MRMSLFRCQIRPDREQSVRQSSVLLTPLPCWHVQSYDAAEFDTLVEKYEKLNWRIIRYVQGARTAAPVECNTPVHCKASCGCMLVLMFVNLRDPVLLAASLVEPPLSPTTSTCCLGEAHMVVGGGHMQMPVSSSQSAAFLATVPLLAHSPICCIQPYRLLLRMIVLSTAPVVWLIPPRHSTTPAALLAPPLPCSFHQQALKGDNSGERPMWAEKGGLDFEGRSRWDAWTAVKVRPPQPAGRISVGSLHSAPQLRGVAGITPPTRIPAALSQRAPTAALCSPPQGMPGDKAKLAFVKAYYEFLPKSLYSDTR